MYRAQAQRREAQSQAFDYPAMMAALELEAGFGPATPRDLDRVTELIQRTNQFNTTTIRYTRSDLQKFLESPAHAVYVADLADKFGKLGLVGVVIAVREDSGVTFDSFVMSCRAMGFGLEGLMLARRHGCGSGRREPFIGRFHLRPIGNTPASGLFQEHGFRKEDATSWQARARHAPPGHSGVDPGRAPWRAAEGSMGTAPGVANGHARGVATSSMSRETGRATETDA